jgi:hypothetical protein
VSDGTVHVQEVNRPGTRRLIGHLQLGCKPTSEDYARWGITEENVISSTWRRVVGGAPRLVIVVHR